MLAPKRFETATSDLMAVAITGPETDVALRVGASIPSQLSSIRLSSALRRIATPVAASCSSGKVQTSRGQTA